MTDASALRQDVLANDESACPPNVNEAAKQKVRTTATKTRTKAAAPLVPLPKSVDAQVQHTNDDSVVSKRSAGRMGYVHDDYLRHFVKKVARRSPLINRGYYLRTVAMTHIVEQSLKVLSATTAPGGGATEAPPIVQVVSLGAGFDTLAMRCYDRPDLQHVHWYDVDFPDVIRNKTQLMRAAPMACFPFHTTATVRDGKEVVAHRYAALGLDLRDTEALVPTLTAAAASVGGSFSPTRPTIVYAECVMQYMTVECSNRIVAWVAATFPNALFFAYDQLNPLDSFGRTMTHSLKSKHSPLLGVMDLPNGEALSRRARAQSMPFAAFANFYRMSRFFLHGDELNRVEAIEAFDEMEEWSEMCEHYGILCGSTDVALGQRLVNTMPVDFPLLGSVSGLLFEDLLSTTADRAPSVAKIPPVAARHEGHVTQWPTGRCGLEGWGFGGVSLVAPHHLHAATPKDYVLVAYGGLLTAKGQGRSDALLVHSVVNGDIPVVLTTPPPPALVFHSFTQIADRAFLIFGGRTNPGDVRNALYVVTLDDRQMPETMLCAAHELIVSGRSTTSCEAARVTPEPRYRHVAVALPSDGSPVVGGSTNNATTRLFVYGGRSANGKALSDMWLLEYNSTDGSAMWHPVAHGSTAAQPQLPPLYGAAAVAVDASTILISGGATSLHDAWGTMWVVRLKSSVDGALVATVTASAVGLGAPRFSHAMRRLDASSLGHGANCIAVHGGSTSSPKPKDDLSDMLVFALSDCLRPAADASGSIGSPRGVVALSAPATSTRHHILQLEPNVLAVVGGGLTCFSFGTYSCKPRLLFLGGKDAGEAWLMAQQSTGADASASELNAPLTAAALAAHTQTLVAPSVQRSDYDASAFFDAVVPHECRHDAVGAATADPARATACRSALQPRLFHKVPLGPCVEVWQDATVLATKDADHAISVHVSSLPQPHFDFVRKNFTFRHVTLKEMVAHCFPSTAGASQPKEFWYFRSVGKNMKTERSDVWHDFPQLAADVRLPNDAGWDAVRRRMHQSCLRVNQAEMQLWTHYDTMDNVLLQMVGRKRVVLFPPHQYGNLYVKGSSSRVTNIDAPDLGRFPRFAEALKHAVVAELHPGDALMIPANWFHHITARTACVGLNLFYHRPGMAMSLFDAKDLYGNKDLPVCSTARDELCAQVVRRVTALQRDDAVPADYARFTLRQLIQDLELAADSLEQKHDVAGSSA